MADNLRSSTKSGQNPTFTETVSKEEDVLGDKAVGGMDDDKDHIGHVKGGLKATMNNPNSSESTKRNAQADLNTLNKKS